jgi:hypothetical protein
MTEHYCLLPPESESLRASHDEAAPYELILASACALNPEHKRWRPASSLALQIKHNKLDQGLIFSWVGQLVMLNQLAEELSKQDIGGFRLRPATVRFRDGQLSHDYSELVVTGWAGVARPESGVCVTFACTGCSYKEYSGFDDASLVIDWDQWTRDDFFIVWPLPAIRLVTSRVADFLKQHQIKGYSLSTLDDYTGGGFTPGRLSDFMPADLAAKYGRPLGIE